MDHLARAREYVFNEDPLSLMKMYTPDGDDLVKSYIRKAFSREGWVFCDDEFYTNKSLEVYHDLACKSPPGCNLLSNLVKEYDTEFFGSRSIMLQPREGIYSPCDFLNMSVLDYPNPMLCMRINNKTYGWYLTPKGYRSETFIEYLDIVTSMKFYDNVSYQMRKLDLSEVLKSKEFKLARDLLHKLGALMYKESVNVIG